MDNILIGFNLQNQGEKAILGREEQRAKGESMTAGPTPQLCSDSSSPRRLHFATDQILRREFVPAPVPGFPELPWSPDPASFSSPVFSGSVM